MRKASKHESIKHESASILRGSEDPLLTRQLDELVVDDDVLGVVQVAGQRRHVRATKFVCPINSLTLPVCPEDPILQR